MRLRGQPQSESLVRRDGLNLLLEGWQPRSDEVQVLQADPFSFHCGSFDHLNRCIVLTTTHGNFVEALSADYSLSGLLQLS